MGPDCLWCSLPSGLHPTGLQGYLGSSEGLPVTKPPLSACAQPGSLSTTFGCICPSLSSTLEVCTNRFCWGHQCPPVSGSYTFSQASPEDCNALTQRRSPSQQNASLERRLVRKTGADLLGTCRPLPCTPVLELHWFSQLLCFLASPAPWRPKAAALPRRSYQGRRPSSSKDVLWVPFISSRCLLHMVFLRLC